MASLGLESGWYHGQILFCLGLSFPGSADERENGYKGARAQKPGLWSPRAFQFLSRVTMGIVTSARSVQNQDRCAEGSTRQLPYKGTCQDLPELEAWPLSTSCPTGSPLQVPRNFEVHALQTFGPSATDPTPWMGGWGGGGRAQDCPRPWRKDPGWTRPGEDPQGHDHGGDARAVATITAASPPALASAAACGTTAAAKQA